MVLGGGKKERVTFFSLCCFSFGGSFFPPHPLRAPLFACLRNSPSRFSPALLTPAGSFGPHLSFSLVAEFNPASNLRCVCGWVKRVRRTRQRGWLLSGFGGAPTLSYPLRALPRPFTRTQGRKGTQSTSSRFSPESALGPHPSSYNTLKDNKTDESNREVE